MTEINTHTRARAGWLATNLQTSHPAEAAAEAGSGGRRRKEAEGGNGTTIINTGNNMQTSTTVAALCACVRGVCLGRACVDEHCNLEGNNKTNVKQL